jgi:uncharacterized membrane protein
MVRVFTLGIIGTILGILAGVYELFIVSRMYTPQQLATMGYSASFFYAAGIAALVFSFIGMAGALVGERGFPSFLLASQYFYLIREKTISIILLIVGAIGVLFATSLVGLPSTILFVVAGVKMWRKKDETAIEQETDEAEQETDVIPY